MKKKAKPGKKAEGKPQTKVEPCDSFFNFFKPPRVRGRRQICQSWALLSIAWWRAVLCHGGYTVWRLEQRNGEND